MAQPDPIDHDTINVFSGVSAFTGDGFVVVRWGTESGQLSPAAARQHALHVLECADAAENDALTQAVLREDIGLDVDTAARFLVAIRNRRPD
jgi:hypothetical protein